MIKSYSIDSSVKKGVAKTDRQGLNDKNNIPKSKAKPFRQI